MQQDNRPSTSNATAFSSLAADLHRDDFHIVNRAGTKKSVTRKTKPVERWEGDKSEVNIGVYEEKCGYRPIRVTLAPAHGNC